MKVEIKIKPLVSLLRKHHRFLAFCGVMLIILFVGLIVVRFVNTILTPEDSGELDDGVKELRVDMRLYREVIGRMNKDQDASAASIDGLENPFR